MGIQVLGPLTLDGVDSMGLRDRVVLETLVVRGAQAVDKEVLADALYGDSLPATWPKVVQGCIARLRRSLGADTIQTTAYGYRLVVHDDELDARTFERLLGRAREQLAGHDPDRASYVLAEALSLWRGRALPDLTEWEPGRVEAERLEGLRMDAQELRIEAEIAAGRSRNCLDEARTLVKEAPFRERRWCLFARALYQSGRQTEALDVLSRARRMLREELGLDPGAELVSLEEAILRQDPELATPESVAASAVCPYRGLLPYEAEDAESFFGRDVDVAACLKRLRGTGVLAVVGPSGSGKSSVVRAGVVAALGLEGVDVLVTTPGARPLDSLAPLPARGPLPVLVVDQAEEAVMLAVDADERAAYFERLGAYGGQLVIALRADRLGDLSSYPSFARLLDRGFYLLAAMSGDDLRAAIEGPARHAGLRLEPGLVDLLVREVEGEPGALPMLSHVLRQTWEHREGATLTVEGYRRTGGIRNAVAQSAERLYERLDEWQRSQLRSLLLRLVVPGEDGKTTRARVSRDKLVTDPSHGGLVEALMNARLLSSDEYDVQIAHEALAREWPRLRDWLDEDVEGQRTFRHLAAAADAWDKERRPDSELYRGVRLARASEWAVRNTTQLTETERAFLDASQAHADVERRAAERQLQVQRRANRRLRLALGGIAVLLVAALTTGVLAMNAADQSKRDATIADSRRLAAQALTITEPDVSLLLGVEAVRLDDSLASRSTLYEVLAKASQLFGVARPVGVPTDVEVSPDGNTIAVMSSTGSTTGGNSTASELATYDAATLAKTAVRDDLGGMALEYSPDGRSIAVSVVAFDQNDQALVGSKPLQIIDAASLEPVGQFSGIKRGHFVEKMDFSSNGKRFAAVEWSPEANRPTQTLVWDVELPGTPILRVPMPGLNGSVEFSPDGRVLYVTQRIGPIRAIDIRTGRELASRPVDSGGERGVALALSDDGATVANASVHGIEVRDSRDLMLRTTLAGASEGVSTLTFSRDGKRLAAGYSDGNTIVWDLANPKPLNTLRGHTQEVWEAAFSLDGASLYTVASDGQLLAWDLAGTRGFPPWRKYPTNPQVDNPYRAIPSPDGSTVAYVGYGSPDGRAGVQLRFRDVASGKLTKLRYLPFYAEPILSWSPDSRRFLTFGGFETIPNRGITHTRNLQTWNPANGAIVEQRLDTKIVFAKFTRQGEILAMSAPPLGEPGPVNIGSLDPDTLQPDGPMVKVADEDTGFWPIEVSSDGRTVLIGNGNKPGGVVVDLAAGTSTAYSADVPAAWEMALSPDGSKLVVYGFDALWGVLDVRSLSEDEVRWPLPRRPYKGVEVWNIFWSADGNQLFTSGNGSVELWDANTLTHLGSMSAGSKDNIATVRPLPDGYSVMMAHPQGDVLTWDLRPEHLLNVACSLAGRNLTEQEWKDFVGQRAYSESCSTTSFVSTSS